MSGLISLFLMMLLIFSGSGSDRHDKARAANSQGDNNQPQKTKVSGNSGNGKPVTIPSPALLPGLIGLGLGAWRQRKTEQLEANS